MMGENLSRLTWSTGGEAESWCESTSTMVRTCTAWCCAEYFGVVNTFAGVAKGFEQ